MARPVSPDAFANELLASAVRAPVEAAKAVKKGAQNIKTQSQANVLQTAPVHNGGAHRTITYDEPIIGPSSVRSEIGYDRDAGRAAALGNLLEYGGGGDKSPAHRDIGRATDDEEPRFEDAIRKIAGRLL